MAFIDAAGLRRRLPNNGPGLTDAELTEFIEDWKARLAPDVEGVAPTPPDTPATRAIVRRGAFSEAFSYILTRDGYAESPLADSFREEAERLLAAYLATNTTPGEGATVDPTDGVSNRVGILWSDRELDSRLGPVGDGGGYINNYPGSDPWDL